MATLGQFLRPSAPLQFSLTAVVALLDYPSPPRSGVCRRAFRVRLEAVKVLNAFAKALAVVTLRARPTTAKQRRVRRSWHVDGGARFVEAAGLRRRLRRRLQRRRRFGPVAARSPGPRESWALPGVARALLDNSREPEELRLATLELLTTLVELQPSLAALLLEELQEVDPTALTKRLQQKQTSSVYTAAAGRAAAARGSPDEVVAAAAAEPRRRRLFGEEATPGPKSSSRKRRSTGKSWLISGGAGDGGNDDGDDDGEDDDDAAAAAALEEEYQGMTQTDQTVLELFDDESYEMDKYRLLDRDRNVFKRLQSMFEASVDTATADGARASAEWERCAKKAAGYDPSAQRQAADGELEQGRGGKGKKDGRSISFSLTAKKGEEAAEEKKSTDGKGGGCR